MSQIKITEPERVTKALELCKTRIEEFDRNYFSLRDIEWKLVLECLAGQVLLVTGYYTVSQKEHYNNTLMAVAGISLPIILFFVYYWLRNQLHVRLEYNRECRNYYIDKSHEIVELPKFAKEKPLPYAGTYAYRAQMVIQLMATVVVVGYVLTTNKALLGN